MATAAIAQMGPERGQMMRDQGMSDLPMKVPPAPTPFYRERTFLVLLGAGIAAFGIIAYRVGRSRWRGNSAPAEFVSEAVLVVDLVGSTHLATHFGETFALRAAEVLQERTLAWAQNRGLLFVKNTGDGCFMTFSTVLAACETAIALLRDVINRPPDLAPLPALELRAGISYGEILMDSARDRHASAINKAFRLEGLSRESFAQVEGENSNVSEIAERNRIFLDEEAAQELQNPGSSTVPLRFLGFARLRGFSGLHRVYEVLWTSVAPTGSGRAEQEGGESRLQ
ncbi:MAG: adenylate/guanylate cyclase domain-containing protein [Chloroflexota bacterium]